MRSHLKWIAATGLAVWGLSALAGHLPSRVRLLLLLAIAFGLLTGWGAGVIADEFGVRRSRLGSVLTAVLTITGLANVATAAYRQSQEMARATVASDPQQLMALRVLEGAMKDDPELQQRYREEKARLQPDFGDYLTRRLLVFGHLSPPWPAVIWSAELLAGGVAAAWMFRREVRRQTPDVSKSEALEVSTPDV
jgi:hypothetical protein